MHPAPPPSSASLQDQLETQRKQLQQELLAEEQRVATKAETERQKAALGELEQQQGAADAEMVEAGGEDELDAFMGTVAVQLEQDKVGWSAAAWPQAGATGLAGSAAPCVPACACGLWTRSWSSFVCCPGEDNHDRE